MFPQKTLPLLALLLIVSLALAACSTPIGELPMEELPEGIKIIDADSNDGTYRATLYMIPDGDAKYYRAAVTTLATGETKNVYFDNYTSESTIEWLDNTTLKINGISIDVTDEVYDFRTQGAK